MLSFWEKLITILFVLLSTQASAEWLELSSDDERSVFIETDLIIPYLKIKSTQY